MDSPVIVSLIPSVRLQHLCHKSMVMVRNRYVSKVHLPHMISCFLTNELHLLICDVDHVQNLLIVLTTVPKSMRRRHECSGTQTATKVRIESKLEGDG